MAVLGYLAKLERGLGLAFGQHSLSDFPIKNVASLILYQWTNFNVTSHFLHKISNRMSY